MQEFNTPHAQTAAEIFAVQPSFNTSSWSLVYFIYLLIYLFFFAVLSNLLD